MAYRFVKLNVQLAIYTKLINNACKPAKGTVLYFRLDLIAKKNKREKIKEKVSSTRKVPVVNPIASTMKNSISPRPKVCCKAFFIFIAA